VFVMRAVSATASTISEMLIAVPPPGGTPPSEAPIGSSHTGAVDARLPSA
jgi:hypothetical protein